MSEYIINNFQYIAYSLELLGYILVVIDIFFSEVNKKIEQWIDRKEKIYLLRKNVYENMSSIIRKAGSNIFFGNKTLSNCNKNNYDLFIQNITVLMIIIVYVINVYKSEDNIIISLIGGIWQALISLFPLMFLNILIVSTYNKIACDYKNIYSYTFPAYIIFVFYINYYNINLGDNFFLEMFVYIPEGEITKDHSFGFLGNYIFFMLLFLYMLILKLFFIVLIVELLILILIYSSFYLISFSVRFLNKISQGRAIGSIGLIIATVGISYNTYQVVGSLLVYFE